MKLQLVLSFIVSSSLFALTGASHAAELPSPAFHFDSIHMVDRDTGWAQNIGQLLAAREWEFNDNAIWKTTDGGKSWKQVLRAGRADGSRISTFFRDAKRAWVASADDTAGVIIFRTRDGGESWVRTQLRAPTITMDTCLSFSGADEGWLMLIADHGMNSSPGDLYHTSDGGAHWQPVNSTYNTPRSWVWEDAESPDFKKPHPYLICGGTVALQGKANGWLYGSLASTTPGFLFSTRDGGWNWRAQDFAPPASLTNGEMEVTGLPQFFAANRQEGIVAAEFRPTNHNNSDDCQTVFYRTRNGGRNWQPAAPTKFSGVWQFITPGKGWAWSAESHSTGSTRPVRGTLYRTEDGGASWKPTGTGKSLEPYLTHGEDIVQLDFVDSECGWAIARDPHDLTQLLHTTDGGETWSALPVKNSWLFQ